MGHLQWVLDWHLICLDLKTLFGMSKMVNKDLYSKGQYIKYDRNFFAFFDPLPSSDSKLKSLMLNTMTSL